MSLKFRVMEEKVHNLITCLIYYQQILRNSVKFEHEMIKTDLVLGRFSAIQ